MKQLIPFILALTLSACSNLSTQKNKPQWRYDVATNVDEILHTETRFFSQGDMIYNDQGSGTIQGVTQQNLASQDYRWFIGGGFSMGQIALPDRASISWFSYYDRTNYQITLSLPQNLAALMCKNSSTATNPCSNTLVFGLAPGGYVELLLRSSNSTTTHLLAQGMAQSVHGGKTMALNNSQLAYALGVFERTFLKSYQKTPIPYGQEWKVVMNQYPQPFID